MTNRLASAISPYLRSHAENPVDWWAWGEEAFAEARRRDVPVLVSIGYSTCHWCHVMARESFSDPALAAVLNERFVAVKVDREEHPEVDSAYLAAAGAFTQNLGWPLNVFTTGDAKVFYGGTYSPPVPVDGHPSFRQVLDAVWEAWTARRGEVETLAGEVAAAVGAAGAADTGPDVALPGAEALAGAVGELLEYEDTQDGGFGGAPKFPVAPVLRFLLASPAPGARELAHRTLRAMAESPLRDAVEGGFFRYATRRDWSDPHYERMLYDNALLLDAYTIAWAQDATPEGSWARDTAAGVASFLVSVMQLPGGGFASAQDSESTVDGRRVEGGYYLLDAAGRAQQSPPALDEKVLTGWNGLAISALARAGLALDDPALIAAARHAADFLLAEHMRGEVLVRASVDGVASEARATLEDYGMLAEGLLRLGAATGSVRYAEAGRMLVDAVLDAGFSVPGGGDPVLGARGLAVELDPSEGAYPSGSSAVCSAALLLHALTGRREYRSAVISAVSRVAPLAVTRPISFGTTLELLTRLSTPFEELVLIEPDGDAVPAGGGAGPDSGGDGDGAREERAPMVSEETRMAAEGLRAAVRMATSDLVAVASESAAAMLASAGFELFAGRTAPSGVPTAYLCHDAVCRLPATTASALAAAR
ncbi:thioredoxin domain-containing protein [Herbiconiux sp. A18JL235]|uniref:Thioredoxin domain-containing protein n=1 Tax=Herbiconiux sp. A18JL235 TaxID=3152363 RepID=A0AB39BD27_9MICO